MLNIPSNVDDPNYRYKMPKLVSKIEGRGNGIRTKIVNMGDIARALKRPAAYPTKFFGCELGALSKWEDKEERSIVNGAHQQPDLQKLMDKFIGMYVLCPNCDLPEIDIIVKREKVSCKCNACGHAGLLDNAHKIATFITKNPPGGNDSTLGKKKDKSKKDKSKDGLLGAVDEEKKKKHKDKENRKGKTKVSENSDGTETDDDVEGSLKIKKEKKKSKAKSLKKKEKKENNCNLCVNDLLCFNSPEVLDVISRLNLYVESRGKDLTPDDFFQELRTLQVSQDFDSSMRFYISLDVIFGTERSIDPEIFIEKLPLIRRVIEGALKSYNVISVIEFFCVERNLTSLRNLPYILKTFYDEDILDEKTILKYYVADSPPHYSPEEKFDGNYPGFSSLKVYQTAKGVVQPFLSWLTGSDSESDHSISNDMEECDQVDRETCGIAESTVKLKNLDMGRFNSEAESSSEGENVDCDEESDLDIDDI